MTLYSILFTTALVLAILSVIIGAAVWLIWGVM
jgi:hypothetical protein